MTTQMKLASRLVKESDTIWLYCHKYGSPLVPQDYAHLNHYVAMKEVSYEEDAAVYKPASCVPAYMKKSNEAEKEEAGEKEADCVSSSDEDVGARAFALTTKMKKKQTKINWQTTASAKEKAIEMKAKINDAKELKAKIKYDENISMSMSIENILESVISIRIITTISHINLEIHTKSLVKLYYHFVRSLWRNIEPYYFLQCGKIFPCRLKRF